MPGLTITTFILYIKGKRNTRLVFKYPFRIRLTGHDYTTGQTVRITSKDSYNDIITTDAKAKITNIIPKKTTGLFANEVVELEIVINRRIIQADVDRYKDSWLNFYSANFSAGWILILDQCIVSKPVVST